MNKMNKDKNIIETDYENYPIKNDSRIYIVCKSKSGKSYFITKILQTEKVRKMFDLVVI